MKKATIHKYLKPIAKTINKGLPETIIVIVALLLVVLFIVKPIDMLAVVGILMFMVILSWIMGILKS